MLPRTTNRQRFAFRINSLKHILVKIGYICEDQDYGKIQEILVPCTTN